MLTHDIRGALRLMRAQPALSTTIVLMLALGLGASTAIFSVIYSVLLKPLPFPDPDRIVEVSGLRQDRGWGRVPLTEANFWDLHDRNQSFEAFGILGFRSFSLTGVAAPERVSGGRVTAEFFRALGVSPAVGRLFQPGDDEPGRESQALLSHRFWKERFGADPAVAGRAITLDNQSYAVIGVLPPGSPVLDDAQVFVPFVRRPKQNRGSFEYFGVARLKPGVTVDAALADATGIARSLEAEYPESNKGLGVAFAASRSWIASDQLRRTLWILLGAVGLLLAIACLNVTNLLLVRASGRGRENAVRTALGARRSDLVRERLTESLLYSAAGSALGWVMAAGLLRGLQALEPAGIPRLAEIGLSGWALGFAAACAVAVGLVSGLVPALRSPMDDIVLALRQGSRGAAGDRAQSRLRGAFAGVQVALALTLMIGAGLLGRSLLSVLSVDRGFQTANRLLVTVSLPSSYGEARLTQTNLQLIDRLKAVAGIEAVAAVSSRPLGRGSTGLGLAAGETSDVPGAPVPWASWRIVTPDYFKVMGVPLLAGRTFTEADIIDKPWRVILSKRAADRLWPGEDPIGRTAILWKGQSNRQGEVIGVVGDMRERGLETDPTIAVYFSAGGALDATTLELVMHTSGRPQDVIPAVRAAVAGVDPQLPVSNIRTLDQIVTASIATRRLTLWLLLTFAALALVLALAGVYGILAFSVARRTPEIGVRLALGAEHGMVLRSILAGGMRTVAWGAAAGLVAAIGASRLLATMLFEIQPHDPTTYLAAVAIVLLVAVVACYVPARRILRVDPAIALRNE